MPTGSWGIALAVLALTILLPQAGQADSILRLSTGAATVTIEDNSTLDLNPDAGIITYLGSVGAFNLNVSTGLTKPQLGGASKPHLDLNSVDLTSTGGDLTISFTDTGFTELGEYLNKFQSSIGGVNFLGDVTYNTYLDSSNTAFGTEVSLANLSFAPGTFSGGYVSTDLPGAFPYSLTQVVSLSMSGPGSGSFNAELRAVPEPGLMLLLASGLAGFAIVSRLRLTPAPDRNSRR